MLRHRAIRIYAGLLFLCAAAVNGFAHSPPTSGAPKNVDLSAFVLPDGSLPTLCLTGDEGAGHSAAYAVCDACRLQAAPGLVGEPCHATESTISFEPIRFELGYTQPPARLTLQRPSQRAPPVHDFA